MKIPHQTLQQICSIIGAKYIGHDDHPVSGINEIHMVEKGDIVFVDHPKYYDKALQSAATTIIITKEVECPPGKALILSDDPFRDYNRIVLHFQPVQYSTAERAASATVGKGTVI